MQNRFFFPIFLLIALSMVGVIGMQYYWLYSQYKDQQSELKVDTHRVIRKVEAYLKSQLNNRVDIDADKVEDLELYASNEDSSLVFLFEPIQRKRNFDGSDYMFVEGMMKRRVEHFKTLLKEVENDQSINKIEGADEVSELFVVLYGQDPKDGDEEKNWPNLVAGFQLDSLINFYFEEEGYDLDFDFGIMAEEWGQWLYVSPNTDTTLLEMGISGDLFEEAEQLVLLVQNPRKLLLGRMLFNLLLSTLLILIILGSFFYLASVIWKQKQVSEIKTDFINNMTHEFKTPLATIAFAVANINNPKIIKDEKLVRQFTNVILEENKRMDGQVEQVLNAALAEKKAFKLEKEEIDIHDILEQLSSGLRMKIKGDGGQLLLLLGASQSKLQADKLHISNMLSNIIDNARKYSPDKIDIRIQTKDLINGIQVVIIDKGMGMNKETIKKIFEKFYRVPSGNLHNIKGFGLGLNYAKAVAEQHGGNIEVESKLNEGSTFSIFLPFNAENNEQ